MYVIVMMNLLLFFPFSGMQKLLDHLLMNAVTIKQTWKDTIKSDFFVALNSFGTEYT